MSKRTLTTPAEEPLEMGGVPLHPGSRVGNYVFLREIGSGGMARVLLAKDPAGELVALKVLRKNRFKTGLARFRREFRALSKIHHPNVIRVEAYGDLFGHPYIAMEYVDGPDLHTTIRGFKAMAPDARYARVEEILVDLCRALAAVHKRGLVHRDLKPSNVLMTREGVSKLTDFGIVKDLDPAQDPLLSTTLVGTWAYASPEQITGRPIDHRSDLYSLGVILFAMLTGKRPFVAEDMAGYLELHQNAPAPAPSEASRDVPPHLDEICRRLLQKAPRDRFQSAQEILYRLEAENAEPVPNDSGWTPPLVGRDLEVEVLTNAVAALTDHRGSVVVVEGDDGSGKSRLLEVAAERARNLGFSIEELHFTPGFPTFTPLIEMGRRAAAELGERKTPKALTEALRAFDAGSSGPVDARFALYDGLKEGLSALLDEHPVVLLLDDLHDAHPREIDLLGYLVRNLLAQDERAVLFLASLRGRANAAADGFAERNGIGVSPVELGVGALSVDDLLRIVRTLVPDEEAAVGLADRLHRETEGNAYFVTEFLRSMQAQGAFAKPGEGRRLELTDDEIASGHLEIPAGVRQVLRARLEGIGKQDRKVLEALSLGSREVDLDVLLDVLGSDEEDVADSLDRLMAAGIVRERRAGDVTSYSVTHRKFADVVYRDLVPDRRVMLHKKMAEALELHYAQNPAALEVVGEHYRRAGDAGRAYRYLVAAAQRLAERSLAQEAWELSDRAGALEDSASADLGGEEFRALRRSLHAVRGTVHYNRAEWADAEKTWRAVLQMAETEGDLRGATEAALQLATVLRRRGRGKESSRFAQQALESSRRLHYREGVADALHCMAALAWTEGDLDGCERLATEGLLVATGSQLADRRAELLLALTVAQATRGQLAAATAGLTEAESIFRELRKKRPRCLALANLAELLTWQGEPLAARQRAHVALQLADELDYKLGRCAANRALGLAALDLGRLDDAALDLGRAVALADEIDLPEEIVAVRIGLGRLAIERREPEEARRHAQAAVEAAERRDPERSLSLARALYARAVAHTDPEGALAAIAPGLEELPTLPVPRQAVTALALVQALYEVGDHKRALPVARALVDTASSRGYAASRWRPTPWWPG
jgi:serine/threonine protein kinase